MKEPLRVTYFTAGAAGMFCGSCMHDNTLARALIQLGVDVQLVPLYTPIRTDETSVAQQQVFFGGINMYLQQQYAVFRYLPGWLDSWLNSSWIIRLATSRGIQTRAENLGALAVSVLQGEQGHQKKEVQRLLNWLQQQSQPHLLVFTNMLVAGALPAMKRTLGCPVLITLQGDDIFLNALPEPYRSQALAEIKKLHAHVDGYITNSHFYADTMSNLLQAPREKFHVIPLGIDTRDFQDVASKQSKKTQVLGYLARLAPEKGLHVLIDAFIHLRTTLQAHNIQLKIAGWLGAQHVAYVEEQKRKLAAADLTSEVTWVGEVTREQKTAFLHALDWLCVPTVYQEPKGLFVLEALAAGVPVILPNHGSFPETLSAIPAGVLFPPHDAVTLAQTIVTCMRNEELRATYSQLGRDKVLTTRNASSMAEHTLQLFQEFASRLE